MRLAVLLQAGVLAGGLAGGLSSALLTGCAQALPHVAQGEAYSTGNAPFDDFFLGVRDVRADALAAHADEDAVNTSLIKGLGIEDKAVSTTALQEATLRAKKLQEKGVLLHLEIAPAPKLFAVRGKTELGPDGEALLKATEAAARSSLDIRKRLAATAARAAELEKQRVELRAQAPVTFRDEKQGKRDEIIAELDAAKGVLADAGESASRSAGIASRFVVELVQAVETGAGAMLEPGKLPRGKKAFAGAAAAPSRPSAPSPSTAAAPAAAGPAAPPPPKKKPKGGDDFEP